MSSRGLPSHERATRKPLMPKNNDTPTVPSVSPFNDVTGSEPRVSANECENSTSVAPSSRRTSKLFGRDPATSPRHGGPPPRVGRGGAGGGGSMPAGSCPYGAGGPRRVAQP